MLCLHCSHFQEIIQHETGTDSVSLGKGWVSHIPGVKCPCPLLGDHRLTPRAGQQRIPAGLSRCCQGEGEGGDDHLLPHQRSPGQLTTGRPTAARLPLRWQDRDCRETECSAQRWAPGRGANTLGDSADEPGPFVCCHVLRCTHVGRCPCLEAFSQAARELTKPQLP